MFLVVTFSINQTLSVQTEKYPWPCDDCLHVTCHWHQMRNACVPMSPCDNRKVQPVRYFYMKRIFVELQEKVFVIKTNYLYSPSFIHDNLKVDILFLAELKIKTWTNSYNSENLNFTSNLFMNLLLEIKTLNILEIEAKIKTSKQNLA